METKAREVYIRREQSMEGRNTMLNRNGLGYISLVVAAYMIGVSNLWKFPTLVLEYGLSGVVFYSIMVALMIPMISAAMESTKNRRYELVEFYNREFNTLWPAMAFFLFDILLLAYYPTVSGWLLRELAPAEVLPSGVGSALVLLLFFAVLTVTLMKGGTHTMDAMVVSLLIAFTALILASWTLYSHIGATGMMPAFGKQLTQVLSWKGVSGKMLVDTAEQAAYSVGIGMGFYLLLGGFLPKKVSPVKVATIGVVLDTLSVLLSTLIAVMAISISPTVGIGGSDIVTSALPKTLESGGMTAVLYFLYLAFFFAALSSMIPLGEVVTRVLMELSTKPLNPRRMPGFRRRSVLMAMSFTLLLGLLLVAAGEYGGVDAVGTLDTAVETFILFGAVLEVLAVLYGKEYVSLPLKAGSYPGIIAVFLLGTLAVWGMVTGKMVIPLSILIAVLGLAVLPGNFWRRHLRM